MEKNKKTLGPFKGIYRLYIYIYIYWGYIGTMKKKMETLVPLKGYIDCLLNHIGIMEKKMETTV